MKKMEFCQPWHWIIKFYGHYNRFRTIFFLLLIFCVKNLHTHYVTKLIVLPRLWCHCPPFLFLVFFSFFFPHHHRILHNIHPCCCRNLISFINFFFLRKLSFKRKKFLIKFHPEGYVSNFFVFKENKRYTKLWQLWCHGS